MKMNPDCVRDILIEIEEKADGINYFCFASCDSICSRETPNRLIGKYSREEVIYHIVQCHESGFFVQMKKVVTGVYKVNCLSPKGHEFLNNIRNNSTWNKIREKAIALGGFSIKTLVEIAQKIAGDMITNVLN